MSDELLGRLSTELGIQVKGFDEALKNLDALKAKAREAGASGEELGKLDTESFKLVKSTRSAKLELERMNATLAEQARAAARSKSVTGQLGGELDGLTKKMGAIGVAGAIGFAVKGFIDLSHEAATATNVIGNLQFSTDAASESTMHLVDSVTLARLANKSAGTAAGQSAEQFAEWTGHATKLALAAGEEVAPTLDRVREALTKGETASVASLVGLIDNERAHREYAQSIGATNRPLSEYEKKQAQIVAIQKALAKRSSELSTSTNTLGTRIDQTTTILNDQLTAMTSSGKEMSTARNEVDAFGQATAVAKDYVLALTGVGLVFATHTLTLNKVMEDGTLIGTARARVLGAIADQADRAAKAESDLTTQLIRAQGVTAQIAAAAHREKQKDMAAKYTAATEDAKLGQRILKDRKDIAKKYGHLGLGGAALQVLADREPAPSKGSKKKKKDEKEEFHLTSFEQLLQTAVGPGFKIGDLPNVRSQKLDPADVKPTSVINVTNVDVGGIRQDFPNATGADPEALEIAAMKAARSELDKAIASAAGRSHVGVAR